jgi:hypothetical protein
MAKNVLPLVVRWNRARRSLKELSQRSAPPVVIKLAEVNVRHLTRLVRRAATKIA